MTFLPELFKTSARQHRVIVQIMVLTCRNSSQANFSLNSERSLSHAYFFFSSTSLLLWFLLLIIRGGLWSQLFGSYPIP
jgi:hypothetical protein